MLNSVKNTREWKRFHVFAISISIGAPVTNVWIGDLQFILVFINSKTEYSNLGYNWKVKNMFLMTLIRLNEILMALKGIITVVHCLAVIG